MSNQTIDTLKKIDAKRTLGLPLTASETAMLTFYGKNAETDAAPVKIGVDMAVGSDHTAYVNEWASKAEFVRLYLAPMLRVAGVDVADVVYRKDPETREEIVTLTYTCGATRDICVTADSLIMIAYEIVKSVYWGEQ
jgi:hypothetical protein